MRSLRRVAIVAAVTAVLAAATGELAVRVFFPQLLLWDTGTLWEPVDGPGWRRKPNLDVHINTGERDVRFLTDGARHRVGTEKREPGAIRILAVGDSMVESVQVADEQTMTRLLERPLSARLGRSVEVVNAGVGGYDPNRYRMAAREELRASRYDLALVFVYIENDLVRRRVESFPANTALVMPALRPFNDSPSETMRVLGVRAQALAASHSHLFVIGRNLLTYWQVTRRPPPATIVHLLSAAERSNRDAPEWKTTSEILNEIGVAADEAGVPVVFVLLPSAVYIYPPRLTMLTRALGIDPADVDLSQPVQRLGEEMRQLGRRLEDATPALRQAYAAGDKDLYGHVDLHFSPAGHAVVARFLEPLVAARLSAGGSSH